MGIFKCNFCLDYLMRKSIKDTDTYKQFNFLNGIRKLDEEEIEKWNNIISTRNNSFAPNE